LDTVCAYQQKWLTFNYLLTKGFTMKYIAINRIFIFLLLLLGAASAQSQNLSQASIEKYIKSVDMFMNADNAELKAIEESVKNNQSFKFDTDGDGNVRIMSQMIETLSSSQLDVLNKVAEEAGFDSIKEWTAIGDKVTAAVMAIEMEKEAVDMSEITPEMMAMMPDSMRKQMEGAVRIMKALEKVPAADIAIVKANFAELQKHMGGDAN
jgi:hypothetical protein